jgi:hypothetical protein
VRVTWAYARLSSSRARPVAASACAPLSIRRGRCHQRRRPRTEPVVPPEFLREAVPWTGMTGGTSCPLACQRRLWALGRIMTARATATGCRRHGEHGRHYGGLQGRRSRVNKQRTVVGMNVAVVPSYVRRYRPRTRRGCHRHPRPYQPRPTPGRAHRRHRSHRSRGRIAMNRTKGPGCRQLRRRRQSATTAFQTPDRACAQLPAARYASRSSAPTLPRALTW